MAFKATRTDSWKGGPLGALVLVLIAAVVYGAGLWRIPVVDRDEARFAQASRQMFESVALAPEQRSPALHEGGLGIPMVGERPRLNKPPLIYWLQSASAAIWSGGDPHHDAIWMYRLPSALAALGAALITWRLGKRMWDGRAGLLAGVLMAVSPMVVWDAHQARADQLLLLTTTGAMACLYEVVARKRAGRRAGWWTLALGLTIGLGVLAKGPITPLVAGSATLMVAVLFRRPGWIGWRAPVAAVVCTLALAAPWAWLVIDRVGLDRAWSIVHNEIIARSGRPAEGHWGPPGYHLLLLPVLFWPGSLLTAMAFARSWRRAFKSRAVDGTEGRSRLGAWWRRRAPGRLPELFCIAWIVPAWIVFELVSTKLPHYTLPLYPAIALISARTLLAADAGVISNVRDRGTSIGFALWVLLGACLTLGAAAGIAMLARDHVALAVAAGCGAVVLLAVAGRSLVSRRTIPATRAGVAASVVSLSVFLHAGAPTLSSLTRSVADEINRLDPDGTRPLAAAGFVEDSLVFHTRGRLVRLGDADAHAWANAHLGGVLVLSDGFTAPDTTGPLRDALAIDSARSFTGINLGRGREETVVVVLLAAPRNSAERRDD